MFRLGWAPLRARAPLRLLSTSTESVAAAATAEPKPKKTPRVEYKTDPSMLVMGKYGRPSRRTFILQKIKSFLYKNDGGFTLDQLYQQFSVEHQKTGQFAILTSRPHCRELLQMMKKTEMVSTHPNPDKNISSFLFRLHWAQRKRMDNYHKAPVPEALTLAQFDAFLRHKRLSDQGTPSLEREYLSGAQLIERALAFKPEEHQEADKKVEEELRAKKKWRPPPKIPRYRPVREILNERMSLRYNQDKFPDYKPFVRTFPFSPYSRASNVKPAAPEGNWPGESNTTRKKREWHEENQAKRKEGIRQWISNSTGIPVEKILNHR